MNLATIIDRHPAEAPAIISAGQVTTYGDLRAQVAAVRGGFHSMIQPGDRVAIVLASNWYFVVSYLAALGAGAIVVPLNPQSPAAELEREIRSVRPRVAIIGATSEGAVTQLDMADLGVEHVLVPEGVHIPGSTPFEDLLVCDPAPVVDRQDDDLAVLMFTSGTAGSPQSGVPEPPKPPREPAAGSVVRPRRDCVDRRSAVRSPAFPHLRSQRIACAHALRRWLLGAGAALRSVVGD